MIVTWNTGNRPLKRGIERHSVDDYIKHILDNTDPDAIILLQEIQQWNKLDQRIFDTHTHTLFTNTKTEHRILVPTQLARKYQSRNQGKYWIAVQIHDHIFISIHALDVHQVNPENNKYHDANARNQRIPCNKTTGHTDNHRN